MLQQRPMKDLGSLEIGYKISENQILSILDELMITIQQEEIKLIR